MKSLHHYKISISQLGWHLLICQSFVLFNHKKIKIQYIFPIKYFNHYFLVTGNYLGSIHVLIFLNSLYLPLVQLLEHDHAISCPLNSNFLNILLLRLLEVTNYISLTTLPPALKVASDATVLTSTVNTSRAIIDNTGYLICCFFYHSKISKSSLSSKGIVSTLRYLSISVVLFGELVVTFFLLLNIFKGLL